LASERSHRLFVALPLGEELEAGLVPLLSGWSGIRGVRPTLPANLHVTAFFIGPANSGLTEPFVREVETIASATAAFSLEPHAFVFRGKETHPSMIWLEFFQSVAFRNLHDRLRDVLEPWQEIRNPFREPVPHITLARIRGGVDVRKEVMLPEKVPRPLGVDRMGLWRTHSTPEGVRYERLSECRLTG
jgi:2'-5' RNA ligase